MAPGTALEEKRNFGTVAPPPPGHFASCHVQIFKTRKGKGTSYSKTHTTTPLVRFGQVG